MPPVHERTPPSLYLCSWMAIWFVTAIGLNSTTIHAQEENWQVAWKDYYPIPLHIRQDWANQRLPDGPLRKWVVQNQPFLADGRSLGPINGLTPLRGLPVGIAGAQRIHFLHWGQPGQGSPEYRVFYSDGTTVTIPIRPGPHFGYGKWYFDKSVPPGQPDACQVWTWTNPHPHKPIHWIDLYTARSVGIYLLAMTAETETAVRLLDQEAVAAAAARHRQAALTTGGTRRVLVWDVLPPTQRPRLLFSRDDLSSFPSQLSSGVRATLRDQYGRWAADGHQSGYANFVAWLDDPREQFLGQAKQHLFEVSEQLLQGLRQGESPQMPGRRLAAACFDYDFLASQEALTPRESARVRSQLARAMYTLIDPLYWQPLEPTDDFYPDNMSSFLLNGVACFALTFPQHPRSADLLQYVRRWCHHMLDTSYGPEGDYMEAMGYGYAAYWPLLHIAWIFRQHEVADLFADNRFRRATRALATMMVFPDYEAATFQDPFCPTFLTQPKRRMYSVGFGMANFGGAGAYWLYLAAEGFRPHDPRFAGELMWTWDQCGQPLTPDQAPGLEFLANDTIPRFKPVLKSEAFQRHGRVLLRDATSEVYCLFQCGPQKPQHHWDKGSFSLQAFGHTLSIDPGVATWTNEKDYNASLNSWFKHPRSHNTLTFTGLDPGPAVAGRLVDFRTGRHFDYACGELSHSTEVPLWRRHLVFLRPDLYLIWDQLESHVPAQFHYHPLARGWTLQGDQLHISGLQDVDTEMLVLAPAADDRQILSVQPPEQWPSPEADLWGFPQSLQVHAPTPGSFLVLLHPHRGPSQLSLRTKGSRRWSFALSSRSGEISTTGTGRAARLKLQFNGETLLLGGPHPSHQDLP